MIYTSSDIVKKALLAADLENSSFLSWYEKTSLLNDAYVSIYQKLVNSGDMSFVSRIEAYDGMSLPCDFWQLKNIYLTVGNTVRVIDRRAPSEGFNTLSYEILGNTIHIYGTIPGTIVLEYFRKPCDILFKAETKEMKRPNDRVPLAGNGDYTIYSSTPYISIYDNKEGTWANTNVAASSVKKVHDRYLIFCGKTMWIYRDTEDNIYAYDYSGNTLEKVNNYFNQDTYYSKDGIVLFNDGRLGVIFWSSSARYVMIEGEICTTLKPEFKRMERVSTPYFTNENFEYFFYQDEENRVLKYYDTETERESTVLLSEYNGLVSRESRLSGNTFYCIDDTSVRRFNLSEFFDTGFVSAKQLDTPRGNIIFNGFNFDTGYGFLVSEGIHTYKVSFVEDTILNFPTNFYYQLLSLQLAIMFCIKQGKDITLLSAQLSEYENAFFDSLTRDASGFERVKNVY